MKQWSKRLAATVLALMMLVLPRALSARERRGADLIITRQDGRRVQGELIAVKPDALVLLTLDAKDESVMLAEIKSIKILRRSKAWQGVLGGLLAGAVGGAIWGVSTASDEWGVAGGAFLGGLAVMGPASLLGLMAGMGAGLDDEIDLAGLPVSEMNRILAKLSRQARGPRVYVPTPGILVAGEPTTKPASSGYERTRFKLSWMPGYRVGGQGYSLAAEDITFRFTEDLPSGEAGPYTSSWDPFVDRPRFSLGRVTLAYQWSRRLASEIELYVSNRLTDQRFGELNFTSTLDGLTYYGYFGVPGVVGSTSLLAGLVFRPFPPAFLQPHVLEFGAAAGPAWISWTARSIYDFSPDLLTVDRRTTTWTARACMSYDYYFSPAFSMGVFAEYGWLQADISSFSVTKLVYYYESGNSVNALTRETEVTFPGRTIALGGLACGLKFGFSF
jgi:hypothetical protein